MTTGGGTDFWFENKFIHHRVKNLFLRGWLLKTYNDGKLLKGRIKTAEKGRENDNLDILFPVGMVGHVKPSEKCEAFTMDIGGDPTRRVIMSIIGDRETHPVPDENEVFLYAPCDKKVHTRFKKKRDQQERAWFALAANGGQGRTRESGREDGIHSDGDDLNTSSTTKGATAFNADKGIGAQTEQGNFTVRAGGNTQMQADKHIRRGETHRDGTMYIEGLIHTGDVIAGGGTSISEARAGGKEYGTSRWNANGRQGTVSLIQTALKVAGIDTSFINFQQLMSLFQQTQQQQNQQNNQQIQDLLQRVAQLEQLVAQLGGG